MTLWAVDYGVLSLTGYRTPDVLGSVYVEKALQVMNTDSRQRIVSRRAIVPKGGDEGGGGGADAGPGTPVRKDFRVLAFWLGSLATDAQGPRGRGRDAAGEPDHVPDHGRGRRPAHRASARATARSASASPSCCARRSRVSWPGATARRSARW